VSTTSKQRSAAATTTAKDQIDWMRWIAAAVAMGMITSVFL